MITALADAGAALQEPATCEAAVACAEFIVREMRDERGRLLRTYNDGQAKIDAYLEDHAFLLEALIALFEATCEERWFEQRHGARRRDDRPLRRPRARRLLLDRRRRRSADRAAQGPRGHADPLRRLERGGRPAAPGPAHRRGASTSATPLSVLRAAARDRPAPSGRVRAPAAGDALAPRPGAPDRLPGPGATPPDQAAEPAGAIRAGDASDQGSTGSGRAPTA